MKKHAYLIFVFVAAFILSTTKAFAGAEQKEWTILVFINGHNNLDEYGKMNINQMEQVGSDKNINMVAQWASLAEGTVRRLYIEKDNTEAVVSKVEQDLGVIDMGDYRQLTDFINWGAQNFPAKKYFVAVWNHGNGWNLMNVKNGELKPQDISYDDISGNVITTEQLGISMGDAARAIGHKIDIYASDACLMAMIEIAAEMSSSVGHFVGSQELEPGEGWPYQAFLSRLSANPTADAAQFATYLVEEYHKAYSGGIYGHRDNTMSALDLSSLGSLNQAIAGLATELRAQGALGASALKSTNKKAQSFYRTDFKDLSDLVTLIEGNPKIKVAKSTLAGVKAALAKTIISNKTSSKYKKAMGLSIWSPDYASESESHLKRYKGLEFNRQTGWGEVVDVISR